MTSASKFLFDRDFRNPHGTVKHEAELQAAEQRGHARGLAEGRRQAEAEAQGRLAALSGRIGDGVATLLAGREADQAALEAEALALAAALGRKLAGEALREQPLAPIAEAARAAFQHLRGVPHLAARVNETLVDEVDALLRRLARERGFEGRLVVLGEPDIPPGDVRLEWADGGVVREQGRIEDAVARALAAARTPF